nr:gag pol polyprotein [Hymenolepis microstoma]
MRPNLSDASWIKSFPQPDEHKQHLRQVFERLQQYGITVNPEKCKFGHTEIDFLGHHISVRDITPLPEKTQSILSYLASQSVKSLRRFLGVVNDYGRFIPNCAHFLQSLTELLKSNPKHFKMMSEAESAFSVVKQELSNATTLNHLDISSGTRLVLKTDVSQVAVGAVLQQVVKGETQPLFFLSKKLTTTETWKIRNLDFIAKFTSDVRHIDGASNVVADAMSHMELDQIVVPSIDLQVLASEKRSDPDFTEIASNPSLHFKSLPLQTLTSESFATFQPAGRDLSPGRSSTVFMVCRTQAFGLYVRVF